MQDHVDWMFKGNYCVGIFQVTFQKFRLGALCQSVGRKDGVGKAEAGRKIL